MGFKSDFLNRSITFNVAGFYTKYRNQQVISSETAGQIALFPLRNIPRSRIIGLEADLALRPIRTVTVNFASGYSDPKYTRGVVAGTDVTGNQMAASAKWTGNFGVDWRATEIGRSALNLHLDGAYQSRVYFDVFQSRTTADDGHTVVNGQISLDNPGWSVSVWAANLFQEKYSRQDLAFKLSAACSSGLRQNTG